MGLISQCNHNDQIKENVGGECRINGREQESIDFSVRKLKKKLIARKIESKTKI